MSLVFSVVFHFTLDTKPDWLDDFRKKYDKPYEYHITLKYPTFIKKQDVAELKKDLEKITKTQKSFTMVFDTFYFGETPNGKLIMVKAHENDDLIDMQKNIYKTLKKYGKVIKEHYQQYEKHFKAHITIARHLSYEEFKKAQSELPEEIHCSAQITKVTLVVESEEEASEMTDPKNEIYYELKK